LIAPVAGDYAADRSMLGSADATPLDGRVARSHRTRGAIVDALIALLEDGQIQPTVEDIAARAGVAPRTVFQHYPDREALFVAVSERRQPRLESMLGHIDADGQLAQRIEALVDQRARLYEWIAPVRRAALLMEPFSAAAHCSLDALRARKRDAVARIFAAELAAADQARRAALEAALGAATSLRTHQRLDVGAARAAMHATVRALLAAG
jgi:TetR/AcrR family transcriptional regulator, regulator of autoinduction and epiphytic fitness